MDSRTCGKRYSPYLDSYVKRGLDITVCLLLMMPTILILLVIMLTVLIFDGKPVIFFQKRVGKGGKQFVMAKVRTMKKHTPPSKPACSYDTAMFTTKTGRFLRKHRLDELPQIFSVLAGRMSLVGPRPELPNVVKNYKKKELKRICIRPGITGLWQIRAPHNQPIHRNIRYDLYYLKKANLMFDIRILAATIPFVLKQKKRNNENCIYTYNLSLSK